MNEQEMIISTYKGEHTVEKEKAFPSNYGDLKSKAESFKGLLKKEALKKEDFKLPAKKKKKLNNDQIIEQSEDDILDQPTTSKLEKSNYQPKIEYPKSVKIVKQSIKSNMDILAEDTSTQENNDLDINNFSYRTASSTSTSSRAESEYKTQMERLYTLGRDIALRIHDDFVNQDELPHTRRAINNELEFEEYEYKPIKVFPKRIQQFYQNDQYIFKTLDSSSRKKPVYSEPYQMVKPLKRKKQTTKVQKPKVMNGTKKRVTHQPLTIFGKLLQIDLNSKLDYARAYRFISGLSNNQIQKRLTTYEQLSDTILRDFQHDPLASKYLEFLFEYGMTREVTGAPQQLNSIQHVPEMTCTTTLKSTSTLSLFCNQGSLQRIDSKYYGTLTKDMLYLIHKNQDVIARTNNIKISKPFLDTDPMLHFDITNLKEIPKIGLRTAHFYMDVRSLILPYWLNYAIHPYSEFKQIRYGILVPKLKNPKGSQNTMVTDITAMINDLCAIFFDGNFGSQMPFFEKPSQFEGEYNPKNGVFDIPCESMDDYLEKLADFSKTIKMVPHLQNEHVLFYIINPIQTTPLAESMLVSTLIKNQFKYGYHIFNKIPDASEPITTLLNVAFDVYNACRVPFPPSSIKKINEKLKLENLVNTDLRFLHKMNAPLFVMAPYHNHPINLTVSYSLLHPYLIIVWSDATGLLKESCIFNLLDYPGDQPLQKVLKIVHTRSLCYTYYLFEKYETKQVSSYSICSYDTTPSSFTIDQWKQSFKALHGSTLFPSLYFFSVHSTCPMQVMENNNSFSHESRITLLPVESCHVVNEELPVLASAVISSKILVDPFEYVPMDDDSFNMIPTNCYNSLFNSEFQSYQLVLWHRESINRQTDDAALLDYCHQMSHLSWLNMSPLHPYRKSLHPPHLLLLKQLWEYLDMMVNASHPHFQK